MPFLYKRAEVVIVALPDPKDVCSLRIFAGVDPICREYVLPSVELANSAEPFDALGAVDEMRPVCGYEIKAQCILGQRDVYYDRSPGGPTPRFEGVRTFFIGATAGEPRPTAPWHAVNQNFLPVSAFWALQPPIFPRAMSLYLERIYQIRLFAGRMGYPDVDTYAKAIAGRTDWGMPIDVLRQACLECGADQPTVERWSATQAREFLAGHMQNL
jgi:hypothetical protein